jgi:hypothetical protein
MSMVENFLAERYGWHRQIDSISYGGADIFRPGSARGGSFFFKRGEHDRENASLLFTIIVHDLLRQTLSLKPHFYKAVDDDPGIAGRALKEQFDRLII